MVNVAVFASGMGSNALSIIDFLNQNKIALVSLIVCNKHNAGVRNIAIEKKIPYLILSNFTLNDGALISEICKESSIDFIVLAGYLRKIPISLIAVYRNKILNIHPSLLPNFGGEGMYGAKVHEVVKLSGVDKTGITIHLVDEVYDHGEFLFQKEVEVSQNDSVADISSKVLEMEHYYYPRVLQDFILKSTSVYK